MEVIHDIPLDVDLKINHHRSNIISLLSTLRLLLKDAPGTRELENFDLSIEDSQLILKRSQGDIIATIDKFGASYLAEEITNMYQIPYQQLQKLK